MNLLQRFFHDIGDFSSFAYRATWKGIREPIKPKELLVSFYTIGYQTLPVVLFAALFAGLSQTLFLESELDDYGAKMTIGRVLGITAIRELGPLVVGLMLTGKVAASIAAEIGSMKVNDQVDAIIALGQDPERVLASPRIWGMTLVALPVVVLTNLMTLFGGWLVSTVGSGMFWYQATMAVYFRHVSSSLVKPFVFGWMISTVACYYGLRCEGGVRGVGEAVSKTVVTCCIWLFIVNALVGIVMIAWTGIEMAVAAAQDLIAEFKNIHFSYSPEAKILHDISFTLKKNQTLVILGGSGSGKSTILRLLLGLIDADSGSIHFHGDDITELGDKGLMDLRKRVGMVFQNGALFDSLTVGENVGYFLLEHGMDNRRDRPEVDRRVLEMLKLVGLEHTIDMMPDELSGGMRRRVAAARTLIYKPELILYDEPTTGLDPATCENMCKVINDIKREAGVSSIMVTHNLEDAWSVGDHFLLIRQGHMVFNGTAAELRAKPADTLAKFFRGEDIA